MARICSRGILLWSAILPSNARFASRQRQKKKSFTNTAHQNRGRRFAPLGTDWHKPFLETAPWLIAVFAQPLRILADGTRSPIYYSIESVGIATGILVTAVHLCGLTSLTHTPSPMGFLNRILKRPSQEKPFLLLVVGHPAPDASVPDISRKRFAEISSFV